MLDETDLRIDVFKHAVPFFVEGDQFVRITHLPTGLVAQCGTEKSQLANKALAMEQLERLIEEHSASE